MSKKINSDIALLLLLTIAIVIVIFPILGNLPLNPREEMLLKYLEAGQSSELSKIFMLDSNLFIASYTHLVSLFSGLCPWMNGVILLRLPGVLVVMTLTLCLFNFDGEIDRLNSSFLASLLFLSSGLVLQFTYQASPIVLPASLFIFAMMSLYHWLHHQSRRYFFLLAFSTALATTMIGATAPIAIALMAYVFIGASDGYTTKSYIRTTAALLLSCLLAFISIDFIVGDTSIAMNIFHIRQQLSVLSVAHDNNMAIFVEYITLAVFPWSIPLLISLPWLVSNPKWILSHFLNLSLLERLGVILFLFSLPALFFFTDLSFILLITSIFFNMPIIGKYLLMQFHHHPSVWRITGILEGWLISTGTILFIILKCGVTLSLCGYSFSITESWTPWSVFITASIFISTYSLWRNKREIDRNNRYLYNIVVLYILSVILSIGYIASKLIVTPC